MALMLGPNHPALLDPLGPDPRRPHKAFGESLAAARFNRAYTQPKLADEVGVSRDQLREWEHGYRLPGAHHLRTLVAILGLRWDTENTVANDPIHPRSVAAHLTPIPTAPERRECAFDPRHLFTTVEVPAPLYCQPRCAGAAGRQEIRLARLAAGRG